jgi:hypothetical protein
MSDPKNPGTPLVPMPQPIVDPGSSNVQVRPGWQPPAHAADPTAPTPTTGPKTP